MMRTAICTVALALLLGATATAAAQPSANGAGPNSLQAAPPHPHAHHAKRNLRAIPLRKTSSKTSSKTVGTTLGTTSHRISRAPARHQPAAAPMQAHAYLMRGFMNVFSLGLDDLAVKLQADGITTAVTNHADADLVVAQIVARYQAGDHGPIILIGHSLGADAVIEMAQALDRYAVPVGLLVLFDGTAPHPVPDNVATAINFTKQFDIGAGPGFHGVLSNVDLRGDAAIDHLTIDKSPALQATVVQYALQAAAAQPVVPARRP